MAVEAISLVGNVFGREFSVVVSLVFIGGKRAMG